MADEVLYLHEALPASERQQIGDYQFDKKFEQILLKKRLEHETLRNQRTSQSH
jgi:hypothetical protein